MVAGRDWAFGRHAEMVGSVVVVCGFGLPQGTESMLFQLPHMFVVEADPSRFDQGGTLRVAKLLHVCMCLARMRKRTCAMTKSKRLCHVGARFFGCAPPPPATVASHQRCGKTCA